MTVVGTNFATTAGNTYRCQFEMSSIGTTLLSAAVIASSATRVVCTAPAFPAAGNSVLRIITQTGSTVIKSGGATSVFAFAMPVASISAPAVFVMADCGSLQTLTFTVSMFHPTSDLAINSTLLFDRDTGAVVSSGLLASSTPSKQYSVNFTWTPGLLSTENVSRLLNFSVVVSEVGFAVPDTVQVRREVMSLKPRHVQTSRRMLQIEVRSPPEFIAPSPAANVSIAFPPSPLALLPHIHLSPPYPWP